MSVQALRARYVFPVEGPPLENGLVTLRGERIESIGPAAGGPPARDLGDVALLPGLVNAHAHLEFSSLPEPLGWEGMDFVEWVRHVIAWRGRRDTDPAAALAAGAEECRRGGAVLVGEIATADWTAYEPVARLLDATLFAEAIGFSSARAASAFEAIAARVGPADAVDRVRPGLAPHAPYTVHPELLARLVEESRRRRIPLAFHLAESRAELRLLREGDGPFRDLLEERGMWDAGALAAGGRPLGYLDLLAGAERALVIHGNYLDSEELDAMAGNAATLTLVYCPRTHARFGHPPYPLAEALGRGVRVAVGTDGRASNPDLSLWEELRHAARRHAAVGPAEVLRLGTLSGAEALGRAGDLGSLVPGKLASLVAVRLPRGTAGDPTARLFDDASQVVAVWHRGGEIPVESGWGG